MASRLILRIQEHFARLTPREQQIAKILLQNHQLVETHTATELSAMADVSKATTARFFRTLGFSDFDEVRLQAREERNRTQPYVQRESHTDSLSLGRSISDHVDLELANLQRTFEELRSDMLPDLARRIGSAPQVWFLGFGVEDGLARAGASLFSRLRHDVRHLDAKGHDWSVTLAGTGPKDLLILLTLSPRPRMLRSVVTYARTTRMRIITVTDHAFSAQASRFSDAVLPCHVTNFGGIATHATLLSMIRLLAIAYAGQNSDLVAQRLQIIERIDEELDLNE